MTRRLLTVAEAAERTTLAPSTFYAWRSQGKGPASFKLGGRVVFDEAELEAWIEEQASAASSVLGVPDDKAQR